MKMMYVSALLFCGLNASALEFPSAPPPVLQVEFAKSFEGLSAKVLECDSNKESLDAKSLAALKLTKAQLKTVLAYQFAKLKFECSREAYADYLIAAKAVQQFNSTSKKPETIDKLDALLTSTEKYRWDAQQRYSELPKVLRDRVESSGLFNGSFKMPFKVLDTMR